MPRTKQTQTSASQNFTLPDEKIVISRSVLREALDCLMLSTPLMDGKTRPPERHWSAIKSMKLYHAKKLIRQALSEGNTNRGDV